MQILIDKINKIIETKFPELSNEKREEMLLEYGELGILKTIHSINSMLDSEAKKAKMGQLFNEKKIEEAVVFAESQGINVDEIFEKISKEIVTEIFS